jgi:hypothetical protein
LNRGGQQERQPQEQVQSVASPPAPVADQSKFAQEVSAPPTKKRTSPRVAQLRKQLRPKLLSAPNELDEMDSQNPEHQQVVGIGCGRWNARKLRFSQQNWPN